MRKTRLRANGTESGERPLTERSSVPSGQPSGRDDSSVIALLLSLLLVYLTLIFPAHPREFDLRTLMQLPLELPVIILLLLMSKKRAARWLSRTLVLALGLLLLLRLADLGSFLAFNRRFSPLLEIHLLADGWNLASTTIGPLEASLVVLLILAALGILARCLYRGLITIAHSRGRPRQRLMLLALISLVLGLVLILKPGQKNDFAPVNARLLPEFKQRLSALQHSIRDQQTFVSELQHDSVLDVAQPSFSMLQGRDIILIFVESYGRAYLDADRFAAASRQRLTATQDTLNAAGLSTRSGWLSSPIRGGRSWLAQATLQSGLTIDNQARFDRLISSHRISISGLFQRAGWHTIGVMPAIQLAWPEGHWYGYQSLHVNANMGFAGERFGYVTMPDQYTLSYFEQTLRHQTDTPVMATLALLSTHAPWTPLPEKVEWRSIGNGAIYDGSHRFGEPISWEYRDKVQDMYALSFDYTLDVLGEYAARYADDALIIVVGDHQPPPIINGWGNSADVPVHLITRDPSLFERLPDSHWMDGMRPNDDVQSQPMSTLRHTLSTLFE